jgi:hypothetical protein
MRVGEIKIRSQRIMQYASIGTFIASMATALKVDALPLWLILCGIPIVGLLAWLDPKVFKGEFAYSNRNNEEWREMVKMVRDIHERQK